MNVTYQGTLANKEAIFTNENGEIFIEKDHSILVEATIEEQTEAILKMANISMECFIF